MVIVEVPEPGAGMLLGLKLTVFNDADKLIAESKSPEMEAVIVEVAELP